MFVLIIFGGYLLFKSGTLSKIFSPGDSQQKIKNSVAVSSKTIEAKTEQGNPVTKEVSANQEQTTSGSTKVKSDTTTNSVGASGLIIKLKDGKLTLNADTLYVASKNGEKFHKPDCRIVESITVNNIVQYTSREEADKKMDPCGVCKP